MKPEKWEAYMAICRKVESGGRGDDISRDPRDLALQAQFVDTFARYLPATTAGRPSRVLVPGGLTEAVMLADCGYEVHALALGADNMSWLDEQRRPNLHARERDAHDLDYPADFFDGYFSVQTHEHWISPFIHIGEVRCCSRDGAVAFVDACGTTNPEQRVVWHTNLVPEQQVLEQWQYWGWRELWRGPYGDDRPQFVLERLPLGHSGFKHSGYLRHVFEARR